MPLQEGMISAPQPEAVDAGADILREGGNAVDAAIACALVQGVVDPLMTGIAGFGSIACYLPDRNVHEYIDFHAPACGAARSDMWATLVEGEARDGFGFFLKGRVNELGYQSISVPTALAGYHAAHESHGRLPWRVLVEPAMEHARSGWVVRPHVHSFWCEEGVEGRLGNVPRLHFSEAGKQLYCRPDLTPKRVGDRVVNSEYATVLELLARRGATDFYEGELAHAMVADHRANGGLLSLEDLKNVQVLRKAPLADSYRGTKVTTNNPPGGGAMLIQMLNILENFDLAELEHNSPAYMRVVSETMKYATADKDAFIGDPYFMDVPLSELTSKAGAGRRAAAIRSGVRARVDRIASGIPLKDTTHVSVIDKDGNCVSMTHTLGLPSGVITPGLGYMYNGCMSVFDPRPGRVGSIAPGKRRFSSMCPSILFRDQEPFLVIGAPGATQIAMGVLQVILNIIDFRMSVTEAVNVPRFSATSNAIDVSNRISRFVTRQLERDGYEVVRSPLSYGGFAAVHAIKIEHGKLDGGADPWHDGMALAVRADEAN